MRPSFPDMEYSAKKALGWRDSFLGVIQMVTLWLTLMAVNEAISIGCPAVSRLESTFSDARVQYGVS
jgi:hypothetical protein